MTDNTLFKHSPGGLHHNKIDFILVSKRCQSRINGAKARVIPGADIGSDHDLLMMTMKVKLTRRQRQDQARLCFDIEKLKDPTILNELRATLGGKFTPLLLLDSIQCISSQLENAINDTTRNVLGIYKKQNRQPWATVEVLQAFNERRALKLKRYTSPMDSAEYNNCNSRVRRKI